jgi:hypothetical protein
MSVTTANGPPSPLVGLGFSGTIHILFRQLLPAMALLTKSCLGDRVAAWKAFDVYLCRNIGGWGEIRGGMTSPRKVEARRLYSRAGGLGVSSEFSAP